MKQKLFRYLSYGSLAAVILAMTAATVVERLHGTEAAFKWVYHNPLFIAFWAVAAVTGIASIRLLRLIANRGRFGGFAYYCWVLGVLAIILTMIF